MRIGRYILFLSFIKYVFTFPFHMSLSNNNKRLRVIRNNIQNYLNKDCKIVKGVLPKKPIEKVDFDKLFLNIFLIKEIYLTPDLDRFVIVLENNHKYIFYCLSQNDKLMIKKLIDLLPNSCRIVIISDIQNVFDEPTGFLYSQK